MSITIRAGERVEVERGLGEYEPDVERTVPCVDLIIGGIRFRTDCHSNEQARDVVVRTARELGLSE